MAAEDFRWCDNRRYLVGPMEPHNPFAGETPFPIAGEGVLLKFTTRDIATLHGKYGPDVRKPPEFDPITGRVQNTFWQTIIGWVSVHDPVVLTDVLKVGLKEPGPNGRLSPIKRDQEWWDTPPFRWADIAETIEFGLMWSRWGETPDQLAERLRKQIEEADAKGGNGAVPPDPTIQNTSTPSQSGLFEELTSAG